MKSLDELRLELRELQEQGRLDEAALACRELLRRRPGDSEIVGALARIRATQQRWPEALEQYEKASRLAPGDPSFHFQRALALNALGRRDETINALRTVCELDRKFPRALSLLVQMSVEACDWRDFDQLVADLTAMARQPGTGVDPFLLLQLCDDPDLHLACARNFVQDTLALYRPVHRGQKFAHAPTAAESKIRVGYLSGDFRNHPTTHLINELIECHDRNRFEIVGVSTGPDDESPYRDRIVKAFDRFIDTIDWPISEFATKLAGLKLDILVDLSGHTKFGQLAFLAGHPVPVQVGFLGYPGSTGASFIDYSIVDDFVVPAESAKYFSEQLVHLPGCYQVNARHRPAAPNTPTRAESGLPPDGFVFCSFNTASRILPGMFDVWMRLLIAVPGSVLWMLEQSPEAIERLRREAEARAVSAERLVFAPKLALAVHLARLPLADLILDTFPYNGHTNTSDAMRMGVPVVTCAGRSFGARVAGSIMSAHGVPELVTSAIEEYEALALSLARDSNRRDAVRERIRLNRTQSTLFDTPRFCAQLESAYLAMYETWRAGEHPRSIAVAR
jgi:protein O-GlcNAc transferase